MQKVSSDIIEECKKNKRSAQKIVYERFFNSMYGACRRYVKNDEETLEVLNDGFVSLFQNIKQYKGEGSFEGWVRKIIVNKALDHLRANKKYRETLMYIENYNEEPVFVESDLKDHCDAEELYARINELPPVYQMVFNLYVIDGYSHKEIAEKLNMNEVTSRWYLSESRKMLKEKLTTTILQS